MRIILVNGAPRSGKDTVGALIKANHGGYVECFKLSAILKDMAHRLYDLPGVPHDHFEDRKDKPMPIFYGRTPRQVYIAISEKLLKPLHGEGFLGTRLAIQIASQGATKLLDCAVVTDSGFRDEAIELIKAFGSKNMTLIRLHRPGHDFSADSRGLIDLTDMGVQQYDVHNVGSIASLRLSLTNVLPELAP